jgi:ATP-dependent Clp protease ATP-binding subunit ClpC
MPLSKFFPAVIEIIPSSSAIAASARPRSSKRSHSALPKVTFRRPSQTNASCPSKRRCWLTFPARAPRGEEPAKTLRTLADSANAILFLDELHELLASGARSASVDAIALLKHALRNGEMQCISACAPREFETALQAFPWLAGSFRPVHVRALDEKDTRSILESRKASLEKVHEVTYTGEALAFAVSSASRYLPDLPLPAKALQLLDAAGSLARLRRASPSRRRSGRRKNASASSTSGWKLPSRITNSKRRAFIPTRSARSATISAPSAKKYSLDDANTAIGPEILEEVISRWSGYPYSV